MANPRSFMGHEAQNFFKVLRLIDRTVLPRRLLLSNDAAELVLLVARQSVSLDGRNGYAGTPKSVADAIARLCNFGQSLTHRLETASPRRAPGAGFPAMAIVNALSQGKSPGEYRFSASGWPLSAPAGGSFAALEAAALIASTMIKWRERQNGALQPPTLLLAVSDGLPHPVSISIEDALTVTTTPPAQLGQFVSRWGNR